MCCPLFIYREEGSVSSSKYSVYNSSIRRDLPCLLQIRIKVFLSAKGNNLLLFARSLEIELCTALLILK
jgi:hypothetical protein